MRLLIFADVHVHPYRSQDHEGSRLNNCLDAIYQAFALGHEQRVDALLFAGDLYDRGKALPAVVVNGVIETMERCFSDFPLDLYAVSGNHDQQTYNLRDNPSDTALAHLAAVLPRFTLLDNQFTDIGTVRVHGVPYYVTQDDTRAALAARAERLDPFRTNVLLCHQHYPGCEFGGDFTIQDVQGFDYVFCGHIHQHARFDERPFYSVGSPLPRDLADLGDPKGYLLLDTETGHVTRHLTNYPYIERVVGRPPGRKRNVPLEAVAPMPVIEETSTVDFSPQALLTNYVRILDLPDTYLTVGLNCLGT